jgi:hypothetical protein
MPDKKFHHSTKHKHKHKHKHRNKQNCSNTSETNITSFLKTEPETNYLSQSHNSQTQNTKEKEVDEITLRYLNLKTKLNELWNKLN